MTHPWSSDPARDAAVRAAEDAAAKERTPLPDHRELPERVAALEAAFVGFLKAVRVEEPAPASRPAETHQTHGTPGEVSPVDWQHQRPAETDGRRTERVTLEIFQATTKCVPFDESLMMAMDTMAPKGWWCRVVPSAEADAEIERLRRYRDEALARVGNVKMERDGAKKRVAELEARVAELEAVTKSQSVSPTTEETSQQPLLTAEEKKAADFCAQLLYKNYPHVAKPMRELHDRSGSAPSLTLTAEERAVLTKARDAYADDNDDEECATAERVIDGLLARAGGDA